MPATLEGEKLKHRGSLFYSCQIHSLFHAATIWSMDLCDSGEWAQHLLKSNTGTGKVHKACEADSSYDRWSVEAKLMN